MQDTTVGAWVVYAVLLHEQVMGWVVVVVKCGCEQSTFQHVHCMYIVYTCIYLYIPCWTLNADFVRIWMQDTTVGAWVVMLHEPFMGWVPSNISYLYAWYVHAYLGMYQDMHVCTCISWYVHVIYMYVPFYQIMSRWSGFQIIGGYLLIEDNFKIPQPKREMCAFMPRSGRRPTTLKLTKSCSTSL